MICCLDVHYRDNTAVTACVGFERWNSTVAAFKHTMRSSVTPAMYEPGFFYRRELPYILDAIVRLSPRPGILVIDGFVWLGDDRPGLGAHLFESLGRNSAVIGVAKRPFRDATGAFPLLRGNSSRPLFITAAGIELDQAVEGIRSMHGPFRIPALLKEVDQLCRSAV
jgi:deoxyribonuclease V